MCFYVHWQLTTVVNIAVLPAFVSVRCVTPRSGGVFCCPTEVVRKSTVRKVLSVVGVPVGSLSVPPLAREQTVRYRFCSLVTSGPTIVKTVVVWNISKLNQYTHVISLNTRKNCLGWGFTTIHRYQKQSPYRIRQAWPFFFLEKINRINLLSNFTREKKVLFLFNFSTLTSCNERRNNK